MQKIIECESLTEVLDDIDSRGITGVQRYKAINGFISLKARYRDIPVSGTFELTPLCNLDCKMCYVHLMSNQLADGEHLLSVTEWKDIIKQAVDAGMMYATLTGGECLTYHGFQEVYMYLVSLGIQPDILTNGRLLTKDMIGFLKKYPPGMIQVSLYGSDEDAYEAVTGYRAYNEVIDGIERIRNAGLNVSLAVTPNRYMQEDALKLLDKIHQFGIPYSISNVTLPARVETERELSDYAIDLEAYSAIMKAERNYNRSKLSEARNNYDELPKYVPANAIKLKGLPCGGAHSSFHVNWKGELCPCIAFSASVHYSVCKLGFTEAWERVRISMGDYRPPKECDTCKISRLCLSCPGERSMSEINGNLNESVCKKLYRLMEDEQFVRE